MGMAEWDREEVDKAMTHLETVVEDLLTRVVKLEHRVGHFYERFAGAQKDDTERWDKLREYLQKQFRAIRHKLGEKDDPSNGGTA